MLPIPDNAIDDANVSKPAPGLTPPKPPEAMVPKSAVDDKGIPSKHLT